jgi:hypothetical protein
MQKKCKKNFSAIAIKQKVYIFAAPFTSPMAYQMRE